MKKLIKPSDLDRETCGEIFGTLDETTTIWKCKHGFYWLDGFGNTLSNKFFKDFNDVVSDCRDHIDICDEL